MAIKRIGINYSSTDDKKYSILDGGNVVIQSDLTYGEVCYEMRKELDRYVYLEKLTKEEAYDLSDDPIAYNEFLDTLVGG